MYLPIITKLGTEGEEIQIQAPWVWDPPNRIFSKIEPQIRVKTYELCSLYINRNSKNL